MAILTDEQLHAIREIIRKHHAVFVVNNIGPSSVPLEVLEDLKREGLIKVETNVIEDAYTYGQVMAAASTPDVANMNLNQFRSWLRSNPVPLTPQEVRAVELASHKAAQYAVGLGNRVETSFVNGQVVETILQADREVAEQIRQGVRSTVAEGIQKRKAIKEIVSDLKWSTKDFARDWDRIAITEKHSAMQQGMADHYSKRYGEDSFVAVRESPDACEHCKRLHNGPDGQPRIFKLSTLRANGTNVGRKAAQWLPIVPPVHPNCRGILVRVPAGWGFNEEGELVPGGELGERYESQEDLTLALLQEGDLRKGAREGHVDFQGIPVAIESRKGSVRRWTDADGNKGETRMLLDYGYVKKTSGADAEEIDVYVGPNPRAKEVYVVHQLDPTTGRYDEAKCFLGLGSAKEAKEMFSAHRNDDDALGWVESVTVDQFKRWVVGTESMPGENITKDTVFILPLKKALTKETRVGLELKNRTFVLGSKPKRQPTQSPIEKALPPRPADLVVSGTLATEIAGTGRAGARNPGHGLFANFVVKDGWAGQRKHQMHPALEGWDPSKGTTEEIENRRMYVDGDDYTTTTGGPAKQARQKPRPITLEDESVFRGVDEDIEARRRYYEEQEKKRRGLVNHVDVEEGNK